MSHTSDEIGHAGRGLMAGFAGAEFLCALGECAEKNYAEASKYAMLGFYFGLPLFFDGLMRADLWGKRQYFK